MRICTILNQHGWAYSRRAEALQNRCPPGCTFEISLEDQERRGVPPESYDLLFLLDYSKVKQTRKIIERVFDRPPPLLVSFNTGWPRRLEYFERCRRYADHTIINNREYWDKTGRLADTSYLPNGVDLSVFKVHRPIEQRAPRVLWCGGTLGSNAWRSNLKGYDSILVPMRERLAENGIETELLSVDPHHGNWQYPQGLKSAEEMAHWYNTGSVYVCASLAEGTPNPALEAAACGCTVVSTPVGNMPELISHGENGYLVKRDLSAIVEHVLAAVENYPGLATNMQTSIRAWSWDNRCTAFFDLFRRILGRGL